MSYILNKELGQAILNYLGSQPYAQVAGFIQQIQQMEEINEEGYKAYIASQQAVVPEGDTGD